MKQRCPSPDFAGLTFRRATDQMLDRAHQATRRTFRDRKLAAKLDQLLGSVDDEDEEAPR
jgi:hypothetical protein